MTAQDAPHRLVVQIRGVSDVCVELAGELDLTTVDLLDAALAPVLEESPGRLVFDLTALEFMDSSGIAAMLRAAAAVPSVHVENPSQLIRRVLDATGLTDVLRSDG